MISDSIDVGNQIEIDEQEVEEFIDVYLDQDKLSVATFGTSFSQADVNSQQTQQEFSDDLKDLTEEELSRFLIYLLKSRINILETSLTQLEKD